MSDTAPTDNIVRALDAGHAEVRSESTDTGRKLVGHFSVFNQWTTISSRYEGTFLERIAPGAFDRAIASGAGKVKVLFDHGSDPQIGNKPLGPIVALEADEHGARYEVDLIDTSYNRDFIIPAADAGLLGASFRFSIPEGGDSWVDTPTRSAHNPDRLPERTIHDLNLYEFGPVVFPAYEGATAGLRSRTDDFLSSLASDPIFVARFTERVGGNVAARVLATLPDDGRSVDETPHEPADGGRADTPNGGSLLILRTRIERARRAS